MLPFSNMNTVCVNLLTFFCSCSTGTESNGMAVHSSTSRVHSSSDCHSRRRKVRSRSISDNSVSIAWALSSDFVSVYMYSLQQQTHNIGFLFGVCGRKEGNVLFNDTLNTFYLRLYGVRHMVKDHSDSERKPAAATCATLSD